MGDNVWRYLTNLGASEQKIADDIQKCKMLDLYVGTDWCIEPKDFVNKVHKDLGSFIVYAIWTFIGGNQDVV